MDENLEKGLLILPDLSLRAYSEPIDVVKTGCDELDAVLGVGGLPRGRIVEVLGGEASGKTTLCLQVVANAQKQGLKCGYIDTEHALDIGRARDLGVTFEQMALSQPDSAEQALDLLDMMVRSGVFGVIVLDSVASMAPKAELEGDMSDAIMGVKARLMGKTMRKIIAPAHKLNVLVIFVNQTRFKIGGFTPFPVETTPGGNALKFAASIRIDMKKTGVGKTKNPTTLHKITIRKNKLAIPAESLVVRMGEHGFVNEEVIHENQEANPVEE